MVTKVHESALARWNVRFTKWLTEKRLEESVINHGLSHAMQILMGRAELRLSAIWAQIV
jgi:hypothetical protein